MFEKRRCVQRLFLVYNSLINGSSIVFLFSQPRFINGTLAL